MVAGGNIDKVHSSNCLLKLGGRERELWLEQPWHSRRVELLAEQLIDVRLGSSKLKLICLRELKDEPLHHHHVAYTHPARHHLLRSEQHAARAAGKAAAARRQEVVLQADRQVHQAVPQVEAVTC